MEQTNWRPRRDAPTNTARVRAQPLITIQLKRKPNQLNSFFKLGKVSGIGPVRLSVLGLGRGQATLPDLKIGEGDLVSFELDGDAG